MRLIVLLCGYIALAPSASWTLTEGPPRLVARMFPEHGSSVLQAFVTLRVRLTQQTLLEP